jgi:imidazole glycerol phosphate synthase glutamine amidotransferase subunit
MTANKVVVVRTGTANLASVAAAFKRIGAEPIVTEDRTVVEKATRLVLPGVGTLGASMERIVHAGLVESLRERVLAGRPTIAFCVGLQLLCETSDESPGVKALSVVPRHVGRFPAHLAVPQFGWNKIVPDKGASLLEEGYVYFANSYRVETRPEGFVSAMSDYGGPFVAAFEKGAVLACQFHPELSSKFGLALLKRWFDKGGEQGGAAC